MSRRCVSRIIQAQATADGAGVRLMRSIGQRRGLWVDPFLMLDEIVSDEVGDYQAGFPSHPHRGFETVTYMIRGRMRHRDHLGNEGLLVDGGAQWMTAGRGIVHSEMPEQREGRLHGFQLWINLAGAEKMRAPRYQDIAPDEIPEIRVGDACVRVIAGAVCTRDGQRAEGPVSAVSTQPHFLDVSLPADGRSSIPLPEAHSGVVYVFEGSLSIDGDNDTDRREVGSSQLAVLSDGEDLTLRASNRGARALVLAATPLHEPIVQYGPFVMNTRSEIEQALVDYRDGTLAAADVEVRRSLSP